MSSKAQLAHRNSRGKFLHVGNSSLKHGSMQSDYFTE